MLSPSRRLTAIATALLVFVAQRASVCRVKAVEVKSKPSAHACCERDGAPTGPTQDDHRDNQCPHCGDATLAATPAKAASTSFVVALDAIASPARIASFALPGISAEP